MDSGKDIRILSKRLMDSGTDIKILGKGWMDSGKDAVSGYVLTGKMVELMDSGKGYYSRILSKRWDGFRQGYYLWTLLWANG